MDKLLFILVIEFLFGLFYNGLEPAGMLGQGRKKSFIIAMFFGALISDFGKISKPRRGCAFYFAKILPDLGRGGHGYTIAHMRKDHGGHSMI